jgi:hypothetical protein
MPRAEWASTATITLPEPCALATLASGVALLMGLALASAAPQPKLLDSGFDCVLPISRAGDPDG